MHKVADAVEEAIDIPLLHLADATAAAVLALGLHTVGLLGTRFTMEEEFYRTRLETHGLTILVPQAADRTLVHATIYEELCLGRCTAQARRSFLRIIDDLRARGAEGVIAGCTEIPMLVDQSHTEVPLFDTTKIHAEAAVDFALT